MSQQIKIIFLGNPQYVLSIYQKIITDSQLCLLGTFTNKAKPQGRNRKKAPPIDPFIAKYFKDNLNCNHHGFLIQCDDINKKDYLSVIEKAAPDIIITGSFGQILSPDLLSIPNFGVLNIHPSKLPKYRGASPVVFSLLDGLTQSAVSFIKTEYQLDTGDIVLQVPIDIASNDTADSLLFKMFALASDYLLEACEILKKSIKKQITLTRQNHHLASYCSKIKKTDGLIDFSLSGKEIYQRYKAYYPWPGTYCFFNNKRILIRDMELGSENTIPNNQLVYDKTKKLLILGTKSNSLLIKAICVEGRSVSTAESFWNSIGNYRLANQGLVMLSCENN